MDQWYVDAYKLAQPAIKAVKNKKTKFVPANWDKTYFEWMNNIQPWCVSDNYGGAIEYLPGLDLMIRFL